MKSILTVGVAVVLAGFVSTPGSAGNEGGRKGLGIAKRLERELNDIERSSRRGKPGASTRETAAPHPKTSSGAEPTDVEAFWPSTYDRNIVMEEISGSDLDETVKRSLRSELRGARTRTDLRVALSDVREALGID